MTENHSRTLCLYVLQGHLAYLHDRGFLPSCYLAAALDVAEASGQSIASGTPAQVRFCIWVKQLDENGICAGAILDVLLTGASFRFVDKKFRKRNGWARRALSVALGLYPGVEDARISFEP